MEYTGKIIKISGPVIDIRFDNGKIPPINALVTVEEYAKHAEIFMDGSYALHGEWLYHLPL